LEHAPRAQQLEGRDTGKKINIQKYMKTFFILEIALNGPKNKCEN